MTEIKIKEITIHNFQCHQHTVIRPALSGLTAITGPSDSGKTSIARAIRWLSCNRPLGSGFIRHGEKECYVSMEMEDGAIICREKTPSKNLYIVASPGKDERIFEGFGNDVPQEILDRLGLSFLSIGDKQEAINISKQLDGPFLGGSVSDLARAKVMGQISGAELIDLTNKDLGTDIYREKRKSKRLEEEAKKIRSEVEFYEKWVIPLEQVMEDAEYVCSAMKEDNKRLVALQEKKRLLKDARIRAAAYREEVDRHKGVEEAMGRIVSAEMDAGRIAAMGAKSRILKTTRKAIDAHLEILLKSDGLEAAFACLKVAASGAEKYNQLKEKKEQRESAKTNAHDARKSIAMDYFVDDALLILEDAMEALPKHSETKKIRAVLSDAQRKRKIAQIDLRQSGDPMRAILVVEEGIRNLEALQSAQNLYLWRNAKKKAEGEIVDSSNALENVQKKYIEALMKHGVCPTCGGLMDKEKIKEVI